MIPHLAAGASSRSLATSGPFFRGALYICKNTCLKAESTTSLRALLIHHEEVLLANLEKPHRGVTLDQKEDGVLGMVAYLGHCCDGLSQTLKRGRQNYQPYTYIEWPNGLEIQRIRSKVDGIERTEIVPRGDYYGAIRSA